MFCPLSLGVILSVLPFMDSDYPFGIFKLSIYLKYKLRQVEGFEMMQIFLRDDI
jgi:hypothetical protein